MCVLPNVDCGCEDLGLFVPPVQPSPNTPSLDQKYVVQHSTDFVQVTRQSDNSVRFHETGIQNSFEFGFGPRSDYFVYAANTSSGLVTATVQNLETMSQVFFQQNIGNASWGFSPDGRCFVLGMKNFANQTALIINNLDEGISKTMTANDPSESFWQFSRCGDVIAWVIQTSLAPNGVVNLVRIRDLQQLVQAQSLPTDFTSLNTSADAHQILRSSNSPIFLAANNASECCPASKS